MRLLIVEDSPSLGTHLRSALTRDGHAVDVAADGETALGFLAAYHYDVMLLDLMLPRMDGWAVLRWLKGREEKPRVLVLSARDQVADRVEALDLGADDYLVKPFEYAELLARVHALARRGERPAPLLVAGALTLDPRARLARVDGKVLALSPKEYALLEVLLSQRGRVLSRLALFERLYDARSEASDKVIEVLMSTLRGKLAQAGIRDLIETRRGFGYVVAE
ncbi:response regulator transcription factor [Aerosticca soli]|jgi:two-component system copper resistance phosphate regulon response regulator CusR|uniref:Two-component system response regulator QseB n=1 Tax=Aerosticca soli TaxID=2010829 RepID=A0A2Z6E211_9GAMM|nr:response regulator transcription factor [Aerosticca soli]MDI3263092.1 response regulator transcription factor [Fulvimonas sp.]BBD79060.1 two-component system response regulator QseB [Aerosticca soli]